MGGGGGCYNIPERDGMLDDWPFAWDLVTAPVLPALEVTLVVVLRGAREGVASYFPAEMTYVFNTATSNNYYYYADCYWAASC